MLFSLFALAQFGWDTLGPFGPAMVIGIVGWIVLSTLWDGVRDWRAGSPSHYVLTDQRLLVRDVAGDRDLRLTNLPELRLEAESGGCGSIYFAQPLGAFPEDRLRSNRLARRWLPGAAEPELLIESIPDVSRVFALLRMAQSEAAAALAPRSADITAPPPGVASVRAPVVHEPFLTSVAQMPPWQGAIFVVIGISVAWWILAASIPWITLFFPGFMGVLGVLVLVEGARARDRSRRLNSEGAIVPGRVHSLSATGVGTETGEQWLLVYDYKVDGTRYRGQSREMTWDSAARYGAGDVVRVRYSPANPSESELAE